jgi:hypothetical protein
LWRLRLGSRRRRFGLWLRLRSRRLNLWLRLRSRRRNLRLRSRRLGLWLRRRSRYWRRHRCRSCRRRCLHLWGRRRRRLLSRWSLRRCVHLRSRVRDRRWRWLRRSRALRKNKIWWSWLRAVGRTSRDRSGWRRLFAGRGLFGSWSARRRRFAARQPWRDSSRRRRFLSCGWLLRPGCRWRNRFTARRCRQSARRTTGFDRGRSARTTGRSHTNKIRRNEFVPGRRSIRWNTRSSFDCRHFCAGARRRSHQVGRHWFLADHRSRRAARTRRSRNLSSLKNLRCRQWSRFWQVLRWRVLLSNGFLQLGRICRVHALPSLINNRIGNAVLNRWCLRRRGFKDGRRRYYLELVAREGLAVLGLRISGRGQCQRNRLDVLIGLRRDGLNRWTEVVDQVVVANNVCDILGLADELNISLRWHDVPRVARFRPMGIADEIVSVRSNVIVRVGPGRNSDINGDNCFGRKRSPANVLVALPP